MYPDIYFDPKYGKIYEPIEKAKLASIKVETEDGVVENNVMLRPIEILGEKTTLFDLVTPYGYGGPYIKELRGSKERLLQAYVREMDNFVRANNVVSEFVRFHPIIKNVDDFQSIYPSESIRSTVVTKIHESGTPEKELSKSTRKKIRKILRDYPIEYRTTLAPNDLSDFMKIYYSTMDRVAANDFYYFDQNYFNELLNNFRENILLIEILYDGQVIAAGLYFYYNHLLHAHLSGTLKEYLHISPAYLIRYAGVEWAESHDVNLFFHGGGTTNNPEDSLYKFKKNFSKTEDLAFFVGKKIWQPDVYKQLVRLSGNQEESTEFFPLYRFVEAKKATILITGSSGMLGSQIIDKLKNHKQLTILASTAKQEQLQTKYDSNDTITVLGKDTDLSNYSIDICLNCGFPRVNQGKVLAEVIHSTEKMLDQVIAAGCHQIINVSSQSVYEQSGLQIADESTLAGPNGLYGMTKYALEQLIRLKAEIKQVKYINIRLGSLAGKAFNQRMINRFYEKLSGNEAIAVDAGETKVSFLAIEDAAEALVLLLEEILSGKSFDTLYNLGNNDWLSLVDLAKACCKEANELGIINPQLVIHENHSEYNNVINSLKFYTDLNWQPRYTMEDIIHKIFLEKADEERIR